MALTITNNQPDPVQGPSSSASLADASIILPADKAVSKLALDQGLALAECSEATPIKVTDERAQLTEFFRSFNRLCDDLEDIAKSEGIELSLDALLSLVFQQEFECQDKSLRLLGSLVEGEQKVSQKLNEKLLARLEDWQKSQRGNAWWSTFKKVSSSLSVFATGTAVIGSGGGALAVAAFILLVGVTADDVLNDPVKKKIADFASKGDEKAREKALSRLQLGTSLLHMVASMGAVGNAANAATDGLKTAMEWIEKAIICSKSAGTIGSVWTKQQSDHREADYLSVDHEQKELGRTRKATLQDVNARSENINQLFEDLAGHERAQDRSIRKIIAAQAS